jgi:uncharacterized membrane protein
LALAVPLAIILYVFIKVLVIIKKIIDPITEKLGINHLLGGATITIFAVLLIALIILLLGLLMRIKSVSNIRQRVEEMILKFVPSLNYLKLMADDKLDIGNSHDTWKPVLLFHESSYNAAFIVEEDDSMVTLFVSKGPSLKEGDIVTAYKKDIEMAPATFDQLTKYSREFGKGFISLIKEAKKS